MRILVVDDEPMAARGVVRMLNCEGHEAVAFSDPAEALSAIKEQAFDAVVSDFNMPVMKGDELLRAIWTENPRIALILLSGGTGMVDLSMQTVLSRCPEGTVYLRKPCSLIELSSAVQEACRRSSA